MPAKRYIVRLRSDERESLVVMTHKGKCGARTMKRAQILLKADAGWKDEEIVTALDTSRPTVERTRKRFVEGGLEKALHDDPRPGPEPKFDGRVEAQLVALACSQAPDGHATWTLRLLADRLVELGVVERISYETVRRRLQKTR